MKKKIDLIENKSSEKPLHRAKNQRFVSSAELIETIETGPIGNSDNQLAHKQGTQRFHHIFTFNNYQQDDIHLLETWLKEICVSYCFQEEIGEECGTPHLQGVVTLKKRARITEILYQGIHWGGKHPEIPVQNVAKAYQYASKLKTRTPGTFPYTLNYNVPKPLKLIKFEDFYPWQKDIINIISKEPDDRIIYWFWEQAGCAGKTALAKYICANYPAICISGKSSDCKYGLISYNKANNIFPDIIIYNVPRSNHDYISYEGMESIQDGLFFSGKYESCQALYNPPHIIVFANDEPDYSKMSLDRWHVKNIRESLQVENI